MPKVDVNRPNYKPSPNHRGGYNPNRPRPTAFVDSNDNPVARLRPIVLHTSRGDSKITAAEARELAADLLAAAETINPTAPTEAKA